MYFNEVAGRWLSDTYTTEWLNPFSANDNCVFIRVRK